jgi:hypothetical protein
VAAQRKGVAWTLPTAPYFAQRKRDAESRDFGDQQHIYAQQFHLDWSRVAGKARFVGMISRSDRKALAADQEQLQRGARLLRRYAVYDSPMCASRPVICSRSTGLRSSRSRICTLSCARHRESHMHRPRAELDEVKQALERHAVVVAMLFLYYSNVLIGRWTSDNMKKLDLERFRAMVDDMRVVDPQGATCRTVNELDAVFVVRACQRCFVLQVFRDRGM